MYHDPGVLQHSRVLYRAVLDWIVVRCLMSWLYTAFRPRRGKSGVPSRRRQRVFFTCVLSLLVSCKRFHDSRCGKVAAQIILKNQIL